MKLTKKSKEAFEKWYREFDNEFCINKPLIIDDDNYCEYFEDLPLNYQFGVYVDFFESVGLDVEAIRRAYKRGKDYEWSVLNIEREEVVRSGFSDSRLSARESAVSSANDYYNEIVG